MKFTPVRTIGLIPSLAAQNQVFVECTVHYIMIFSLFFFSLLENKQTTRQNKKQKTNKQIKQKTKKKGKKDKKKRKKCCKCVMQSQL